MRKTHISVPVRKPRNGVVRALLGRLSTGAGRHKTAAAKRRHNHDHLDLAQRVRESGEW